MSYLFWAHVICWLGLFIYVYALIRKNQHLRKEIEALRGPQRDSNRKIS